jgi:hypothetical protein
MSDCRRVKSSGELMARYTIMPSAKSRAEASEQILMEYRRVFGKAMKEFQKYGSAIVCWLGDCKARLHNYQKIRDH